MCLPEDHEYIFICTSLILKPRVWGIREICDFVFWTLSTVHLCTLRKKENKWLNLHCVGSVGS